MSARTFPLVFVLCSIWITPPLATFASPTQVEDSAIFATKSLPEPLVPFGGSSAEGDNRSLVAMLSRFDARQRSDDFSGLEGFVAANPDSRWKFAILTNLGLLQYRAGYFSRCLDSFKAAWESGKGATDIRAKALADRAAGEYAKMLARLGRYPELKAFLAELGARQFVGQATELMMAGKEGVTTMEKRPEIAFRCGPFALSRILASQKSPLYASPEILDARSTMKGMSLAEVAGISARLGMNYQAAKRSPGAEVIMPSVVHWKVGHYAALTEKVGGRYHTQDPTFENETWHSNEALESEVSGYFLVPPGPLPAGWTAVGAEEAATVFGKGYTTGPDLSPSPKDPPTQPQICPMPPAPSKAMATYTFRAMLTSLQITDSPVGYVPPYGDLTFFTATYLQRDPSQPSNFTYSNLGRKWSFNWQQYVTDDPSNYFAALAQYTAEANRLNYPVLPTVSYGGGGGGYRVAAPQFDTRKKLSKPASGLPYTITNPDGSKDIFGQPDGSKVAGRKVFLTQHIDPSGNATTLGYDKFNRLITVTDALGQKTTLSYDLPSDRYKITKVTDPFGRFATFSYDADGRLIKIRDVIGIESIFTYEGGGDFIRALTTPYGTTSFTTEGEGVFRRLTATDPAGDTEVLESDSGDLSAIGNEAAAPAGFQNIYLGYRNSFHWNKKQWREHPHDYAHAHIYHWLHTADLSKTSPILESEKYPLQSRIWYSYPGQPSGYVIGTQSTPNAVGRLVEGGSQITRSDLNELGFPVAITDPLGRRTAYQYAANGIDVTAITQVVSDWPITRLINAGGPAVGLFSADGGFSGSSTTATNEEIDLQGVANPAPMSVYQTERFGPQFTWTDGTLAGGKSYTVRLHFAESYLNEAGRRVFDVSINGTKVLTDFDIFAAAGLQKNKAVVREFKAAADFSGKITILFKSFIENAAICGIEIVDSAGPAYPALATYTWNAAHRPLTYTDAAGQKTTYAWNTAGQMTSVTNAKKETTAFTYYTANLSGKQRKGHLATINGALAGNADLVTFDYDAAGNVASVTGPDGYKLAFAYDALDRLARVTFPDATYTETTYQALSPATSRDRLGRMTSYGYNSIRQLESVTDPLGRTIGYRWCKCGALSQLIDAMGRVTTWKHDSASRVTAKVYADGSTVNYAYQPLSGRLASITDEKGQVKGRSYNLDDTLAGLTYTNAEHPTPNVTFTYDTDFRRLKTMLDGIGTTNYGYYPIAAGTLGAGRLASVDGPLTDDTLTYTYDQLGRNTGYAINGVGETRTFDALGRLLKAVNPLGAFGYTYVGATGRMDKVTYPNGMTCQYNYHPLKAAAAGNGDFRLKDIIHTLPGNTQLSRHSYEYNAVGDVTRWTQISPQANLRRSWLCGYDAADQLTSVASQDPDTLDAQLTGQYGYSYDLAGNRLTETIDGITSTASFNALNQLTSLTTAGASMLPQQTYEWDAEDRLVAINYSGTNLRSEFEYDGFSRRLGVREKQSTTVNDYRRFVWRDSQMAEERTATGASVKNRYFARGMQASGGGGTLVARMFALDHLRSVRSLVSGTALLIGSYDFDPWGKRSLSQGSDESVLAFTRHWYHALSGLAFAPYRSYNPSIARWNSRDPIGFLGGVNLYVYCDNSPVAYFDPLGLAPGDRYTNPQDAASHAIQDINPTSIAEHREYGGIIYRRWDGTYSYNEPNPGDKDSSHPNRWDLICQRLNGGFTAKYHTHGGNDPGYGNENFSDADMRNADRSDVQSYLGTPNGDFKVYTPFPGSTPGGTTSTLGSGYK